MSNPLTKRADTRVETREPATDAREPRLIKAEVNLLRLPLFALQTKGLRDLDGIECRGSVNRDGRRHDYTWRVTRHATRPFPGPLARAAHLALLSILTEQGTPFANPVTWSWRDLCRRIGITYSGRAVRQLKEAIRATHGVVIEAAGAIYSRPAGKLIELDEDDRHLYSRVRFYHRSTAGGAEQNCVWLSGWYLDNLNALYTAPLDHELWRHLDRKSPIASRLYEYLLPNFYLPRPQLRIGYPHLAQSLPVRLERYFSDAQKQLSPALNLLVHAHVLDGARWGRKKAGVAQLMLHRGERLPQHGSAEAVNHGAENNPVDEQLEVREIRGQSAAQRRLVTEFYRLWTGEQLRRPTKKDMATAADMIDRYGTTKARQLVPLAIDQLRQHWPNAKTFTAVASYLPEVAAAHDRERGRKQRAKRQQDEEQRLQEQADRSRAAREEFETRWRSAWQDLPEKQQHAIRNRLLQSQPGLAKMPSLLEYRCLQELARQGGGNDSAADAPDADCERPAT